MSDDSRRDEIARDSLVKKISAAMADGKDSGGYDTLLDMLSHVALKVIEDTRALPATNPGAETMAALVRDLRARRIMCDGGNGNVYDVADEECEQAAEIIEGLIRSAPALAEVREDWQEPLSECRDLICDLMGGAKFEGRALDHAKELVEAADRALSQPQKGK